MKPAPQPVDEWLEQQFLLLVKRPPATKIRKKVAIISTPRCGSTLFCESLRTTGQIGDPSEWLNPRRMRAFGRVHGKLQVQLAPYLDYVMSHTTTDNGIFSLNFHIDQHQLWKKQGFDILSLGFDVVIHLSRRDKISQAYSFAKATATDQWRSHFTPRQTLTPQDIPTHRVAEMLARITAWEDYFQRHLARHAAASFSYEDYANEPSIYCDALRLCGIKTDGLPEFRTKLARQREVADDARVQEIRDYFSGITPSP